MPNMDAYKSYLLCFDIFQRVMRGLQCNVFTEQRNDFSLGPGGNQKAIFEYYFLAVSVRAIESKVTCSS